MNNSGCIWNIKSKTCGKPLASDSKVWCVNHKKVADAVWEIVLPNTEIGGNIKNTDIKNAKTLFVENEFL